MRVRRVSVGQAGPERESGSDEVASLKSEFSRLKAEPKRTVRQKTRARLMRAPGLRLSGGDRGSRLPARQACCGDTPTGYCANSVVCP